MSQEAFATIAGYATADPMLRMTKGGFEVAHVRVACTPRRINHGSGQWEDADTSYFTVTCWRKLATAVRASIRKGDPVLVRGRMRTRQWKTDERTVTEVEIDADAIGHDLTRGWATFNRGSRPPGGPADNGEEARQGQGHGEGPGEGQDTGEGDGEDGSGSAVPADADPWDPIAPVAARDTDGIEPIAADLSDADSVSA
jgi:single-strand DNA-binding protein